MHKEAEGMHTRRTLVHGFAPRLQRLVCISKCELPRLAAQLGRGLLLLALLLLAAAAGLAAAAAVSGGGSIGALPARLRRRPAWLLQ